MHSFGDLPENVKDTLNTPLDFAVGSQRVWDNVAFFYTDFFTYFLQDRNIEFIAIVGKDKARRLIATTDVINDGTTDRLRGFVFESGYDSEARKLSTQTRRYW